MTEGNNPTDRSKLGTKRHILTDKQGIPLSTIITSANTHDIKAVTDVIVNAVIKRPTTTTAAAATVSTSLPTTKQRKRNTHQHLCLDRAYDSKSIKNEIINCGYVPHIPYKRKRGQKKEIICQKNDRSVKNKRWVVERTNSWHNRFRKLLVRFEKKAENYLGLVHLSCSIIIYRKIILG
jgi:putative transposase